MGVWIRLLACPLLCLTLLAGCGAPATPRNFLLVVFDTTRADHIGSYGYARNTTPTVDRLARLGVRFDQTYAQSSLTPVSAASFLTGVMPFRTGVRSLFVVSAQRLDSGLPTLFELFQGAQRRTAAFVSAVPMSSRYGLDRGFDHYDDDLSPSTRRHGAESLNEPIQRPADDTAELAITWLRENGHEPFAMMLHFFDAHDAAIVPPREFLVPWATFRLPDPLARVPGQREQRYLYHPSRRVAIYDAELRFMDREMRRVLDQIDALGLREETVIGFIGDHGEAFGEHDYWRHGLLYEEQLRVPWILAGPGLPEGREVSAPVRLLDLAPTVAALFDLDTSGTGFDGVSLLDVVRGEAPAPELARYAEVHHAADDRRGRSPALHALALGPWKLLHYPLEGRSELFDLASDPDEMIDRYARERETARALERQLASWGAISGEAASTEGISEEELDRLRKLGYL